VAVTAVTLDPPGCLKTTCPLTGQLTSSSLDFKTRTGLQAV